MIAIIDYGAGNLHSVKNALDYLGLENRLTSDKDFIKSADKIILRTDNECGQIGVNNNSSASGSTIGPPADILYPVEPVGVAIITPSA